MNNTSLPSVVKHPTAQEPKVLKESQCHDLSVLRNQEENYIVLTNDSRIMTHMH